MAIILRIVQRFQSSRRQEFMDLEKQFANLEHRGILPKGERMSPLAGREPGNTLIWQQRFENLAAAEAALKTFENSAAHAELYNRQKDFMEDTWVEFYEVLDY
ncbi:MAG: hypothetical protein WB952_12970 [Terriglobales bacterium]